ncbi:acyltransferase [Campylobacter showae]|uniref:acyltransferase family protein n=1 Tax=Campylobacter showae TaxID=204 RepID=UPI0028D658EF|nr:acyltransferase [Campylobacter showae]
MYEENLNYFRGFFATLVVFAHTYQILLLPLFYSETSVVLGMVQFIAAYSVVGFILISGYSIASSLHLNYLKNNKKIDIGEFARKRINRIMPPFLLSILVVFCIQYFSLNGSEYWLPESKYVARDQARYDWELIFYNFLFLNSFIPSINSITMNGPLWSLNFEVYFYVLLATISLFLINYNLNNSKRNISIVIFAVIVYFQLHFHNKQFLYLMIVFFIGVLSYYIRYSKKYNIYTLKKILFIVLIFLFGLLLFRANYFKPYTSSGYRTMIVVSLTMVLFYSIYLSKTSLYLKDFFYTISKYSYTLYVIHFPLLLLSIFHETIYEYNILWILFLLISGNFVIFKFSKYCSYLVERKNYR